MRKSIIFFLILFSSVLMKQQAKALSIKDSTAFSMPVYVIDWTDNDGKPRKVAMVKDSYPGTAGVCVLIKYYDGNTPVSIQSYDPNSSSPWNAGFGGTVHHNMTYHNGGSLTLAFQGPHHAVFNWVQTLDGSIETVTYTFMDGLDYFQWQETVDTRNGTKAGDSRGPYCTMQWDGVDFSQVTGQEYGAQKYFSQPSYNGAWTFGGTVDIPYVQQWDNNREIGFVQSQTFTQQLAGAPNWSGSLNMAASGSTVADDDVWMLDYQMNFYDKAKKITWGMPYGYMNGSGDGAAAIKSGWGQYSLSIVFDALAENGVKRVRDENRVIHNGNVSLTASAGTVVSTGPVGTANPNTQTLSPAGFDHNYRTWWAQANGSGEANLTMTVNSGVLKNPTFRIKNMSGLPGTVEYNGAAVVSGVDYFASFNSSTNEVWLTLKKDVSGAKTIRIVDAVPSGIVISSALVSPASVYNNVSTNLTFAVNATDDGSIASVKLDLTSIGGGSAVIMTLASASTYTYPYTLAAGASLGTKTIVVTVTDNSGNQKTELITLTVNPSVSYLDIYTDASTMITGSWASSGSTLAEQTGGGASEGTKDYLLNFTTSSWYAGFGLNFTNWTDAQAKDFSAYETLEISYNGPGVAGSGVALTLTGIGSNNNSTYYTLPASSGYTTLQIPLTAFGTFDLTKIVGLGFSVTGIEAGSSTFRFDNIRLSKQNSITAPEINVKAGSVSVATGGTYNFNSVVSGNTGTAVTFTIENTGNAALNVSGTPKVAISGTNASEFTIIQTALSASIAGGASSTFTITFAPTTSGSKSAVISIDNNDADENPYTISLTGAATAAPTPEINLKVASASIASAGNYNFTSVAEATSGTAVTFTIENIGTAALTLSGTPIVTISGTNASDFTISQTGLSSSIAAASSATFTVAFSPATSGSKSAVISISSNDSDEGTYTINLTGTATAVVTAPEINVKAASVSVASAGSYAFSSVLEGTSATAVTFTIENTGNAILNLTGSPIVSISGTNASEFTITQSSTASSVPASGTTTFTIVFSPATSGTKTATISIASNDANENPYTISVSGTGLAATAISDAVDKTVRIYPNPASNSIYISTEGGKTISMLTLRNHLGTIVREVSTDLGSSYTMELTGLSSGIYYLEFESPEGKIVRKVVKQ